MVDRLIQQLVRPQSLAVAIAEAVRDYVDAVQAGKLSYPAHRREGASVPEIWADLRIEALHKLFNFGRCDPFLLSDLRRQEELLTSFLDERVHMEMPQPRGEVIPDTIQGMWQVYLYLDAVGSEVADRETDHESLRLDGRSILDQLEAQCAQIRPEWRPPQAYKLGALNPLTMIEILYRDVTSKAKSIALSTVFGPDYESGINYLEKRLVREGADTAAFRASVERLLAVDDPDLLSD